MRRFLGNSFIEMQHKNVPRPRNIITLDPEMDGVCIYCTRIYDSIKKRQDKFADEESGIYTIYLP